MLLTPIVNLVLFIIAILGGLFAIYKLGEKDKALKNEEAALEKAKADVEAAKHTAEILSRPDAPDDDTLIDGLRGKDLM